MILFKPLYFTLYLSSVFAGFNSLCDKRNDLVEIAYDAVIRNIEYRSGFIFIDRNDNIRFLHTGSVLDSAADSDSKIYGRANGLARLTYLKVFRHPAVINNRS